MGDPERRDREDMFRTDVARLVQAMRHYLLARWVPDEIAPLIAPVQRLASLLDAGAPVDHLREAALSAVEVYRWPGPEASTGDEGPALEPAVLAAMERLCGAVDAMDAENGDGGAGGQADSATIENSEPAPGAPAGES